MGQVLHRSATTTEAIRRACVDPLRYQRPSRPAQLALRLRFNLSCFVGCHALYERCREPDRKPQQRHIEGISHYVRAQHACTKHRPEHIPVGIDMSMD